MAFRDQCGRSVDWRFQCDEPVWYSNESFYGYTTIKDISRVGFFTVHAAPWVKNEIVFASKYIKTIPVEKVRELLTASKVPPNEEFLWEQWSALQRSLEMVTCQSGVCKEHTQRRWKCDEVEKEIRRWGGTSNGYILCRPCAEAFSLVPIKKRSCPCDDKFASCPWRRKTAPQTPKDEEKSPQQQIADIHEQFEKKLGSMFANFPNASDQDRKKMYEEVTNQYHAEVRCKLAACNCRD